MAENVMSRKGLKPGQYRAAGVLAATGDVSAATKAAGVSERTLRRWMAEPGFQEQLRACESDLVREGMLRLTRLVDQALDVLAAVMGDAEAPHHARLRAATATLDTCMKWREQVDLEGRVAALETVAGKAR